LLVSVLPRLGLGAIFAGLGMAPVISAGFAASIFMLIKLVVHVRKNPVPWAVHPLPVFFLIAGTICALSIVYKGSPNLGLNKKPAWYVASVPPIHPSLLPSFRALNSLLA
jgi:sodium-dependent phosphate transporter